MTNKEPFILSIEPDVVCDLRSLHGRITDDEAIGELHSADIAALSASMQSLAKRLQVCEEIIAFHCGFEVKDMHSVAASTKDGAVDEDRHEIDVPDVVVPGD